MATMGDYYPAGMDDCSRNGLSGNCGIDCEVFLRGECTIEDEIKESDEYKNSDLYREHLEELQIIENNKFNRWDIMDV